MKKQEIINAAIGGGRISPTDLVQVSRKKTHLTMRHVWDGEDGRVINSVLAAVIYYARTLGIREVYAPKSAGGYLITVVD